MFDTSNLLRHLPFYLLQPVPRPRHLAKNLERHLLDNSLLSSNPAMTKVLILSLAGPSFQLAYPPAHRSRSA